MPQDYSLKYSEHKNFRDAYNYLADYIDKNGTLIKSRNEWTKEVLNTAVLIKNPRDRFIPIKDFDFSYILHKMYDLFNENPPRVDFDNVMLEKTMGDKDNKFYWGNENRSGNSRWSLLNIRDSFIKDKNTRKAVLSYGSRRPKLHYPCMIYSHFIIRDDKLHMTVETRGTALSMGWSQDIILFTVIQEMMLGWLKEFYPNLEMGDFLYKTISMHYFCNKEGDPIWSREFMEYEFINMPFNLNHWQWVQENGALYHFVDECMKATKYEDIDKGHITTINDVYKPERKYFKTEFYYRWALIIYYAMIDKELKQLDNQDYINIWNYGNIYIKDLFTSKIIE